MILPFAFVYFREKKKSSSLLFFLSRLFLFIRIFFFIFLFSHLFFISITIMSDRISDWISDHTSQFWPYFFFSFCLGMLQIGERVDHRGWLIGPKLFWPEVYHPACASSKFIWWVVITARTQVGQKFWNIFIGNEDDHRWTCD